ncbi:MAG TPA: winged helix-turn-helix transcriptional regulator [Pirellulales bacterium]|jgi:predicted ArsR family transcriptional regulator|nr:winged helix-turn-helix transcriptional regulator [Pirellulales bacterium]
MDHVTESSDIGILDLLRKAGPVGVSELSQAMGVTATAVRQRLIRLMAQGLIDRQLLAPGGRGRPSHRYGLTDKGRRQTGANFVDLALALWKEIRAIEDIEVRRGLLGRIAKTMAQMYSGEMTGTTTAERMHSVSRLFADRDVPFDVEESGALPVLTARACPYPELAEQDRGICALERMMFSELVGSGLKLANCRLDGDESCRFVSN